MFEGQEKNSEPVHLKIRLLAAVTAMLWPLNLMVRLVPEKFFIVLTVGFIAGEMLIVHQDQKWGWWIKRVFASVFVLAVATPVMAVIGFPVLALIGFPIGGFLALLIAAGCIFWKRSIWMDGDYPATDLGVMVSALTPCVLLELIVLWLFFRSH